MTMMFLSPASSFVVVAFAISSAYLCFFTELAQSQVQLIRQPLVDERTRYLTTRMMIRRRSTRARRTTTPGETPSPMSNTETTDGYGNYGEITDDYGDDGVVGTIQRDKYGVGYAGLEQRLFVERQTITYPAFFSNYRNLDKSKLATPDPLIPDVQTRFVTVPPYAGDIGMQIFLDPNSYYVTTVLQPTLTTKSNVPLWPRYLEFDIALRLTSSRDDVEPITQGTTIEINVDMTTRDSNFNQMITIRWPVSWDSIDKYADKRNRVSFEVAVVVRNPLTQRARF